MQIEDVRRIIEDNDVRTVIIGGTDPAGTLRAAIRPSVRSTESSPAASGKVRPWTRRLAGMSRKRSSIEPTPMAASIACRSASEWGR